MAEPSRNEHNEKVIASFRANGGVVDEERGPRPLLLLTTAGRRTGRPHTTPVMYLEDAGRIVVFATHGGSSEDPDWFKNLMAAGRAEVEVPGGRFTARPVVTSGEERERLYRTQAERYPQFSDYEARTSRTIPVVVLERAT